MLASNRFPRKLGTHLQYLPVFQENPEILMVSESSIISAGNSLKILKMLYNLKNISQQLGGSQAV